MMDAALVQVVRERAGGTCEYCRMPQVAHVLTFPVDHIIARQHGGLTEIENLALSCVRCNSYKGPNIAGLEPDSRKLTRLYHPRTDTWEEHFSIRNAVIVGLTSIGRTTVALLQMNHPDYLALRESLIEEGLFPAEW